MVELPLKQKRKRNESIQIFTLRYIIWTTDPVILGYHCARTRNISLSSCKTNLFLLLLAVYKGQDLDTYVSHSRNYC